MSRLAVTRAEAPAVIRPRAVAFGLRGARGAAALAESLMARYRLAGTWPADAELHVLTPAVPGTPPTAGRVERARAEAPRPPLHIRLSADIRLLRRLLTGRTGAPASRQWSLGRSEPGRLEVRRPEATAQPARADRPASDRRGRAPKATLPGPAVIRMPAPSAASIPSSVTVLQPIHTHATTETRSLLHVRSPALAEPMAGAPVVAVRTTAPQRTGSAGREASQPGRGDVSRPRAMPAARKDAATTPAAVAPDATRPALPGPPGAEPVRLEVAWRDPASPATPRAEAPLEHPARMSPLAARTRATATRLAAERAPKLAVRSRRGPGPSLDRRTLAGRPTPSAPRITPIIPRAVSQPGAAGDQTAPTRVVTRKTSREATAAVLEGAAALDTPTAPVIARPAARPAGASPLTPAGPIPTPGAPRPQARGDQRRQAVALEVRRAPVPAAPPAPASREAEERASEPRGRGGQRSAEARAKPPQIDAPMLRKALNEMPIGDFGPLADRLIAEFEWQLKRGLERSGRR